MGAFDILGLVFGALGLLGVTQLIWAVVHHQLPSTKFPKLKKILEDTEATVLGSIEQGLVPNPQEVRTQLDEIRASTEALRVEVHSATSWSRQCCAMGWGLSRRIGSVTSQTKELRASVLVNRVVVDHPSPSNTSEHHAVPSISATSESVADREESEVTMGPSFGKPSCPTSSENAAHSHIFANDIKTAACTPYVDSSHAGCDSVESFSTLATMVDSSHLEIPETEDDTSRKLHVSIDPPQPSPHLSEPSKSLSLVISPTSAPIYESSRRSPYCDIAAGSHHLAATPITPIQPNYEISPEVIHQVQLGLTALVTVIHALQSNLNKPENLLSSHRRRPSLSIPGTPTISMAGPCLHNVDSSCSYHASLQAKPFRIAAQSVASVIPLLLPSGPMPPAVTCT